ncbi:uncharacterized protein LOC141907666 [Tubulanus polymorphus]|uniref:uncharacterized protein LOC141903890 n=1 Tax=Tubulanus polymorphus TaxID=672921 RepID=UPI003DA476BA
MDCIELDQLSSLHEATQTLKRQVSKEVCSTLHRQDKTLSELRAKMGRLYNSAVEQSFVEDPGRIVTGAVVTGLKTTKTRRFRPKMSTAAFEYISQELVNALAECGGDSSYIWSKLGDLKQRAVEDLPIVLLGDSMFTGLKASGGLIPICHPGERLGDLLEYLPHVSFRARAIVVTHGMNHAGDYGRTTEELAEVLALLKGKHPSVPLFHLQTPVPPCWRGDHNRVNNINRVNVFALRAGFQQADHPDIPDSDFVGIHYKKSAMHYVCREIIRVVDRA